jgi:hypothetical protein
MFANRIYSCSFSCSLEVHRQWLQGLSGAQDTTADFVWQSHGLWRQTLPFCFSSGIAHVLAIIQSLNCVLWKTSNHTILGSTPLGKDELLT